MAAVTSNPTTINPSQKINSFFENGILPGGGELNVPKSYDPYESEKVPLNCITENKGISVSLFHRAKGGITVAIEESVGEGGVLDSALQRSVEKIDEKTKEKETFYKGKYSDALQAGVIDEKQINSMASLAARNEVLSEDELLAQQVADKAQRTALFLLDLGQEDKIESPEGCAEIGKSQIVSAEKISRVFISNRFESDFPSNPNKKISFVSSKHTKLTFYYKYDGNEFSKIEFKSKVNIPNYEAALIQESESKNLKETPIYTHMTRL